MSSAITKTVRLTLQDASRQVPLPEMIHFQRAAYRHLLDLREAATRVGAIPVRIGPLQFDCLDALRQPLNIGCGAALAGLELLTGLTNAHPGKLVELHLERFEPVWMATASAARALGQSVTVVSTSKPRVWQRLRLSAYRLKRSLQRRRLPTLSGDDGGSILMVPRMPGHLADQIPVARELRDHFGCRVRFVVVDRRLIGLIRAEGFDVGNLYDAGATWAPTVRREAVRTEAALDAVLDSPLRTTQIVERRREELFRQLARRIAHEGFHDAYRAAYCIGGLLDRLRPAAVVVGNPYTMEGRIAAQSARARGIGAYAVEHGSIFPDDPCWAEFSVDEVFVWGTPSRRALESCGVDSAKIVVSGGPRHDAVFREHAETASSRKANIVLVAVSGPGDNVSLAEHQQFIELLYRAAERRPDLSWVVKLHRKDRPEFYYRAATPMPRNIQVVTADYRRDGRQIFEWLARAQALVTVSSTCAVDAMALNVPVVAVDVWPPGGGIAAEFLHCGACRRVRTADELAIEIGRACEGSFDPATRAAADRYAAEHFANRGNAARTVAERIMTNLSSR